MKLHDSTCRGAKPSAKPYKLADGAGLYLLVKTDGKKYWRMKYAFLGKERTLAIGVYPLVSLLEARSHRDAAKRLLANGIDPTAEKHHTKQKAIRNAQNTFKATALEWHDTKKSGWSASYSRDVLHKLETDIFPLIGDKPLATITPPVLLNTLKKIEERGAWDMAVRIRQICSRVFRYGAQLGRCDHDPAQILIGALKTRPTVHYAAIEPDEIPELVRAVHQNYARLYPRTLNAIQLSLLTFQRPTEIREARWEEIDFAKRIWTIPATRMKKKRDNIIPLSSQAIAILKAQQEEAIQLRSDWVFPSHRLNGRAMSNNTVRQALHKLGFKGRMTAHGFRALARTGIREALDYAPDVIEAQLAHKPAGPLGAAYDRAQFLRQRTMMMQAWADYVDRMCSGGTVIHADFIQTNKG